MNDSQRRHVKCRVSVDVSNIELEFTELRSCVKVDVAVLGYACLISLMVSVDVTEVTLK